MPTSQPNNAPNKAEPKLRDPGHASDILADEDMDDQPGGAVWAARPLPTR